MKIAKPTKWIAYTSLFTALTAVAAIVVQIPSIDGGYTNLSDAVIFLAALLMDPLAAMVAGGLGTFLADLLVYPPTMLWSLAFHGVEGLAVGLMIRFLPKGKGKIKYILTSVYMLIGGLLMMTGYYFAKAYVYGTPASALISLWRNAIQVGASIVVAQLLYHPLRLQRLVDRSEIYVTPTASRNINAQPKDMDKPSDSPQTDETDGSKDGRKRL